MKNLSIKMTFILMVIVLPAYSQFEIIKTTDGCKFYDYPWNFYDNSINRSITWNGKCINGFISGYGELKEKTEKGIILKYKGEMLNGKKHGKGKFYYDNPIPNKWYYYDGSWYSNKKNGFGEYYFSEKYWAGWNNGTYTGNWKDDVRFGNGTWSYTEHWGQYSDEKVKIIGNFNDYEIIGKKYLSQSNQLIETGSFHGDALSKGNRYFKNGKIQEKITDFGTQIKYFEDGEIEYTYYGAKPEYSEVALLRQKVKQLENQVAQQSRTSSSNSSSSSSSSSGSNSNNAEMERLNLERPCVFKIVEIEKTNDDLYYHYTLKIPLKNGEYDEKKYKYITLYSDGQWGGIDGIFYKTRDEALNKLMSLNGCKNWYEKK